MMVEGRGKIWKTGGLPSWYRDFQLVAVEEGAHLRNKILARNTKFQNLSNKFIDWILRDVEE